MASNQLLKEAVDALTKVVNSSQTPYPIDSNVIQVIPLWNALLKAIAEEGRELYFTVDYDVEEARKKALASQAAFYVTQVRGRFAEISNENSSPIAIYKYAIENVIYLPILSNVPNEPALRPHQKTLNTWIGLYEFLAEDLMSGVVTWQIL